MGNQAIIASVSPVHARIYANLIQIRDPSTRVQMIQTCLAAMEYIQSAKHAGVYSYLLHYVSSVQSGATPPLLPGESAYPGSYRDRPTTAPTTVPRSLQSMNHAAGIGSVHPSLMGATTASNYRTPTTITIREDPPSESPPWKTVASIPHQKAVSHFAMCLSVLDIQEEVTVTEEVLKRAYKRAALRVHPDKGGTEEEFESVTRAYAYLSEILKRMQGRRSASANMEPASVQSAQQQRSNDAEQWKMKGEPIRLNPKNLDMNAFNKMFEQTHLPDPDSDGYGDWLKSPDDHSGGSGPAFKGKFNRDVFNRMFEEEAKKSKGAGTSTQLMVHPGDMALTLNPTNGTELVSGRPDSFTAAANSKFQYTDLRGAYTTDSTVSDKVADVRVTDRSYDQYRASREKAPDPFSQTELHHLREFEERQKRAEDVRERRRAEQAVQQQAYFDRMKQLVLTDGAENLNSGMAPIGTANALKRIGY